MTGFNNVWPSFSPLITIAKYFGLWSINSKHSTLFRWILVFVSCVITTFISEFCIANQTYFPFSWSFILPLFQIHTTLIYFYFLKYEKQLQRLIRKFHSNYQVNKLIDTKKPLFVLMLLAFIDAFESLIFAFSVIDLFTENDWNFRIQLAFSFLFNYFGRVNQEISIVLFCFSCIILRCQFNAIVKKIRFGGLDQRNGQMMRKCYDSFCQMANTLTNVFGILIAMFLLSHSLAVCAGLFGVTKLVVRNEFRRRFIYGNALCIICFCHVVKMASVVFCIDCVVSEAEDVKRSLQRAIANSIESQKAYSFSIFLQLCEPPEFTAGGYFIINKQLLIKILSLVITYLIILIQFRLELHEIPQNNILTLKNNKSVDF